MNGTTGQVSFNKDGDRLNPVYFYKNVVPGNNIIDVGHYDSRQVNISIYTVCFDIHFNENDVYSLFIYLNILLSISHKLIDNQIYFGCLIKDFKVFIRTSHFRILKSSRFKITLKNGKSLILT